MKKLKKDQANTNDIMKKKTAALHATNVELNEQLKRKVVKNDKRRQENSDQRCNKLQEKHDAVVTDMENLLVKMQEQQEWETEAFQIRHTEQRYTCRIFPALLQKTYDFFVWHCRCLCRGKPLKDFFVWHCRRLLATGSSARSVREQLFLNGAFFLRDELYTEFREAMPELRWFNTQRKGMGYERLLYSFVEIAKCEEVVQWAFDETSLNGIPIKVGEEYRVVTIECSGLLTGSTATRVAEHIKIVWQRGQESVQMLRQELGCNADELVPLVGYHGGYCTVPAGTAAVPVLWVLQMGTAGYCGYCRVLWVLWILYGLK